MRTFKQFITETKYPIYEEYTFESYCLDIDELSSKILFSEEYLQEGFFDSIRGIKREISSIFIFAKDILNKAKVDFSSAKNDLITAFKSKTLFDFLRYFGYSLKNLVKAIGSISSIIDRGVVTLFKELSTRLSIVKNIKERIDLIDDFLNKHPILKKLTGPMIVAILAYIWLNMTFTGNFSYDMNISTWLDVLSGSYSISEIFASPEGLAMLTFLATSLLSGGTLSVAWLGSTTANLASAIAYSIFLKTKSLPPDSLKQIKSVILKKPAV